MSTVKNMMTLSYKQFGFDLVPHLYIRIYICQSVILFEKIDRDISCDNITQYHLTYKLFNYDNLRTNKNTFSYRYICSVLEEYIKRMYWESFICFSNNDENLQLDMNMNISPIITSVVKDITEEVNNEDALYIVSRKNDIINHIHQKQINSLKRIIYSSIFIASVLTALKIYYK